MSEVQHPYYAGGSPRDLIQVMPDPAKLRVVLDVALPEPPSKTPHGLRAPQFDHAKFVRLSSNLAGETMTREEFVATLKQILHACGWSSLSTAQTCADVSLSVTELVEAT